MDKKAIVKILNKVRYDLITNSIAHRRVVSLISDLERDIKIESSPKTLDQIINELVSEMPELKVV